MGIFEFNAVFMEFYMTLLIENANAKTIKAIRAVLDLDSNATIDVLHDCTHNPSTLDNWLNEANEAIELYKKGKLKSYDNPQDMHADIFRE